MSRFRFHISVLILLITWFAPFYALAVDSPYLLEIGVAYVVVNWFYAWDFERRVLL